MVLLPRPHHRHLGRRRARRRGHRGRRCLLLPRHPHRRSRHSHPHPHLLPRPHRLWPPRFHQRTPLAHHPRQLPSCPTACRRRHQRPPPRQRHPAIPRARRPDPRRLGRRRPRRRHHHVPMGTAPSDPTSSRPSNASKRRAGSANGTPGTRCSATRQLSVDGNAMKCTLSICQPGRASPASLGAESLLVLARSVPILSGSTGRL